MPYQQIFVSPELFAEHNGVKVYRRYLDDDVDQGPMEYWFTTSYAKGEGSGFNFDVRELIEGLPVETVEDKRRIIFGALDRGLIKIADDNSGPQLEGRSEDADTEDKPLAPFPTPDLFNHFPVF